VQGQVRDLTPFWTPADSRPLVGASPATRRSSACLAACNRPISVRHSLRSGSCSCSLSVRWCSARAPWLTRGRLPPTHKVREAYNLAPALRRPDFGRRNGISPCDQVRVRLRRVACSILRTWLRAEGDARICSAVSSPGCGSDSHFGAAATFFWKILRRTHSSVSR
jgi:hypothetical protein